jgi:uncharacterized protein (DUF58 family)
MKELLLKLRKYEIEIRKAIDTRMQGNFHSIFKGSGLEFDDVRSYQYGDDIRSIDWNVSSKGHGLYIKTFREDKEQTVFFLVDVSGSQIIGDEQHKKIEVSKEIAGVLALSAVKEGGQVGLYAFSAGKEKYIKPGKGLAFAYQVIRSLFTLIPTQKGTRLNTAILQVLNIVKRKSVMILISDFIDTDYEHTLKALSRRHDLVIIQVYHPLEKSFPQIGIVPIYDSETGQRKWVNTSSLNFNKRHSAHFKERKLALENFCKQQQVMMASINVAEDYVPDLVKLFKVRGNQGKAA